jgi:hypothetical protein
LFPSGIIRGSGPRRAVFPVHVLGMELDLCCLPDDVTDASGFGGGLWCSGTGYDAVGAVLHHC